MKPYVGGGWAIHHLTDRAIELRKDDYAYRRFTGRDGYVRLRAEPGMDRTALLHKALTMAQKTDADLALRIGKGLAPTVQALADYTGKRVVMEQMFRTPEDEQRIGRKSA